MQVTSLGTSVVEVSVSFIHTCARTQLGDGTTQDRVAPVQIEAL